MATSATAATTEVGLSVDRLDVEAGSVRILQGLTFTLYPGELCALIGPSGAGKSTLIKAMLGLREPDGGTISLCGRALGETGPIGYVPQHDALHSTLTVRETITFAARLRRPSLVGAELQGVVQTLCERLDLDERLDVRVRRLSGGQRKRVSVAVELVTGPRVLILDEPTSGLDPGLEARLMGLFSDIASAGRTVVVATHAMQSLRRCGALAVLMRGHLIYFGPPAAAPAHFGVATFPHIFEALCTRSARAWARTYGASEVCRAFSARPPPPAPEHTTAAAAHGTAGASPATRTPAIETEPTAFWGQRPRRAGRRR